MARFSVRSARWAAGLGEGAKRAWGGSQFAGFADVLADFLRLDPRGGHIGQLDLEAAVDTVMQDPKARSAARPQRRRRQPGPSPALAPCPSSPARRQTICGGGARCEGRWRGGGAEKMRVEAR